jgi:hypothetical protein
MTDHPRSIDDVAGYFQSLNDLQLIDALKAYLSSGIIGGRPLPARSERHVFLANLFNGCDQTLQDRLRNAFACLLEFFEPSEPPKTSDVEYLFYLLSLAPVIRNKQAKERLRRWLFANAFDGWKYDIFDLQNELILATSAYDSDEVWTNFILHILPKRANFKNVSLAAYRALWQTIQLNSLSLLPSILLFSNPEDSKFLKSFGYLIRLTIDKAGTQQFCNKTISVLDNFESPPLEIWTVVLRLEELIDQELAKYREELKPLRQHLRIVWANAETKWRSLPPPDSYEMFDKLLEVFNGQWELMHFFYRPSGMKGAFMFRKRHALVITESDAYILERSEGFFDLIEDFEKQEVGYSSRYMTATSNDYIDNI